MRSASFAASTAPTGTWRSARSPRSSPSRTGRRCCSTRSRATEGLSPSLQRLRGQKRTAMTLGLPRELPGVALLNAWRKRLHDFKPVPPKTGTRGPLMENSVEGDDVDLGRFPTPLWHEKDGGRYIGTGDARHHPRSRDRRGQSRHLPLHDPGQDRISVKMNKGKHGGIAMEKYHAQGSPARSRCRSATTPRSSWRQRCRCRRASRSTTSPAGS